VLHMVSFTLRERHMWKQALQGEKKKKKSYSDIIPLITKCSRFHSGTEIELRTVKTYRHYSNNNFI